jgi:alanyl-tRNA synthetase
LTATRHLFWDDPYQREFEAFAIEQLLAEGQPAVILDATAFYPTSGGQPHDLGTLSGVPVRDVVERDDGCILHILAEPLPLGAVHGVIDWPRRFDHMQQHSGQHILSQAFDQLLDATTVSFHLGEDSCTIDLDVAELGATEAGRAEDLANRIVLDDRIITAREYDEAELESLSLRKAPQVHGRVRIVEVAGFDICACGGTHVSSAGQIGQIHISRYERRRGQTRLEFLCGWRALRDYRQRDTAAREIANRLTVGVDDLSVAVSRLQEAEQEARRGADGLRRRLLDCELPHLADEAEVEGETRLLCRFLEGYDAGNMRSIAQALTQQPGIVVLLGVVEPSPQVCFARSADVSGDLSGLLREVLSEFGGRGGGQAHIAQGGGIRAGDLGDVLEQARLRWLGR